METDGKAAGASPHTKVHQEHTSGRRVHHSGGICMVVVVVVMNSVRPWSVVRRCRPVYCVVLHVCTPSGFLCG